MTECPVCHNRRFNYKSLLPNIRVGSCTRCDFLVSDIKRTGPIKAEFSRINDDAYQRSIGRLRQFQAGEILRFVKPYAKKGADWLDVGCSFGYLLLEAKRRGFNVFGVEPDETAMKAARALLGDDVVQHGTMKEDSRPNHSADIVSMLDVLEHVPADGLVDFASMIHRTLRPDGLWVIKVPSSEGLYFTIAHRLVRVSRSIMSGVIKRLWQSEYEYPHTVYFNQSTLKRFLENHGFEPLAFEYLAEVPNSTVIDRLFMDNTIPKWQAMVSVPAFYLINLIESVRGKSDALLALARRKSVP